MKYRNIIAVGAGASLLIAGVALASTSTNQPTTERRGCEKPPVILKNLSEKDLNTQNENILKYHRDCDKTPKPTASPSVSPTPTATPTATPSVSPTPLNTTTNVTINGTTRVIGGATGSTGTTGSTGVSSGVTSLPTVGGSGRLNK